MGSPRLKKPRRASKRGGRRPGAGRKRTLRFMDCMRLGAECEKRWRDAWSDAGNAELEERTHLVQEEWAKAAAVPIQLRKAWLRSKEYQMYLADVRIAMQEDQGIDENSDPARVITITPKRPKGPRKHIIQEVALLKGVSRRMVETCWKKFRETERRLKRDPS